MNQENHETSPAPDLPADADNSRPDNHDVHGEHDPGRSEVEAWSVAIAGWLVPGLGHGLQRMWGRAIIVFLCVGVLVVVGASMRGNLFTSNGNDAFDTLGYVADLGAGSFYFLARAVERTGADVSHAGGDYGTRFLATAGVLNLLAALHAYEAARGRKA
jgi:hypothetical protein